MLRTKSLKKSPQKKLNCHPEDLKASWFFPPYPLIFMFQKKAPKIFEKFQKWQFRQAGLQVFFRFIRLATKHDGKNKNQNNIVPIFEVPHSPTFLHLTKVT